MHGKLRIRPMTAGDLDFAAACTAAEGWASETRPAFEAFLAHQPAGAFVADVAAAPVGIAVATHYGRIGFIGELIVVPAWRGRGIGNALLHRGLEHLDDLGAQTVMLDGMPLAVPLYERAGFRKLCRSLRFKGTPVGRVHPDVRRMQSQDLEAVAALDREAFGADRRFFLERRLALYPRLSWVLEHADALTGFLQGRLGEGTVSAGPWVVRAGEDRGTHLLEALADETAGTMLTLGVLEGNSSAVRRIRVLGMQEHPDPPWRMRRGPELDLGTSEACYAIGSPAKG